MAKTARNPENVQALSDMQVFVTEEDDPKIGKDGVFPHYWRTAGILNDESKVEISRAIEQNKVKGIGFGVVNVTNKPGDVMGSFETLEDDAVDDILWPDTGMDDDVKIRKHSGKIARKHVAWVQEREDGSVKILVTRAKAYLKAENVGRGANQEPRKIDMEFVPDTTKAIFEEYIIHPSGAQEDVDMNQIRFVEAGTVTENVPGSYTFTLGAPTGGTWTLKVGERSATGLAHDAAASAIQQAMRDAGDTDIEVTGDAASGFTITNANGDVMVEAQKLKGGGYPKPVEVTQPED